MCHVGRSLTVLSLHALEPDEAMWNDHAYFDNKRVQVGLKVLSFLL